MAWTRERIACPDLNRAILSIAILLLASAGAVIAGCGQDRPDPQTVLKRTLAPERLNSAMPEATVLVQSLGYEDRVLEERGLEVPAAALDEIRGALGDSNEGFRDLATGLEDEGTAEVGGVETDHVSGELDTAALADALEGSEQTSVGRLGLPGADLSRNLVAADFDLYSGTADGVLRRLDLTLALDDPDNALPPTRIRFSLTGESRLQSNPE